MIGDIIIVLIIDIFVSTTSISHIQEIFKKLKSNYLNENNYQTLL